MRYERLWRIPTMAGNRVDVARDRDGRLVVLKQAATPAAREGLETYARQLRRLAEIEPIRDFYPPVLACRDGLLVLPYYAHGSVDAAAAGDRETFRTLVRRSVDALLVGAQCAELVGSGQFAGVDGARAFWRHEFTRRYDRLVAALSAGDQPAGLAERALEPVAPWSWSGDGLDRLLRQAVQRPLGLAAHGDFGLNNVLLADPAAASAGLRFIDLRGALPWVEGTPYWDPVLDLGTLVAFHCYIEPALGIRDGVAVAGDHGRLTLDVDEVLALYEATPALAGWAERDPHWRLRLRLAVLIRILGSVSTQLTAAPAQRAERARTVAELLPRAADDLLRTERAARS